MLSNVPINPIQASLTFTGDTSQRFTITDTNVKSTSYIIPTIQRANITDENDKGFIYQANIVSVIDGSFDVVVNCLDYGFDDPTSVGSTETIYLNYLIQEN